jgi:hypothetical protein
MAVRYWVGGNGTWDGASTTNWSTTSGGASGASVPTSADNVFFDANSGTGTCTTSGARSCATINLTGSNIGLTLGANLTMSGAFTFSASTLALQTFTLSCLTVNPTGTTARSIAFGTGNITITGNNATVWNGTDLTNFTVTGTPVINATYSGSTGTRTINMGTSVAPGEANTISVNVSSGTDTVVLFGGGTRDLNFTGFSGTWAATGVNKTLYGSLTLSTGMSLAASIGTLTFAATSGTQTITTNNKTIDGAITFNGVGGTFSFADALTQGSTRAFTVTNGTVKLKAGTTNTVGSFATGSGTTQRFLQSTVAGTQATITNPSGTNTATYLTIQDSAATGGATWSAPTGSGNVDAGNNTGWYFSATSSGLSRGTGLYVGSSGLYKGSKGLYGGNSGLDN